MTFSVSTFASTAAAPPPPISTSTALSIWWSTTALGGSPPGAIPLTAVLHRGTVRAVYVGPIDAGELGELLERLARAR